MKKLYLLLILCVLVLVAFLWLIISGGHKDKEEIGIDITDTGFEYNVAACDKYFEVIECIIDKDTNVNYTKEMRIELKNMVKNLQEEWKQLNEEGLIRKCTEELDNYEKNLKENNLDSFGCFD